MPITARSRGRLALLRTLRKKIAPLAKPTVPKRISSDIKRLDKRRARLEKLVTDGKLTRRAAKRELAIIAKTRRGLTRALGATKIVPARMLAAVDRSIAAAKKGNV